MATKIARLDDDPRVPFRFRKGDRVAWRNNDGTLDPEYRGVIVDGICEYQEGGGWYEDRYLVKRDDQFTFPAGHLDIVKLK